MKNYIFFLSTGRCGTQWITNALQKSCKNFYVDHEPLKNKINKKNVNEHIQNIINIDKDSYIETGWMCYNYINKIDKNIKNVKYVHIVRDPYYVIPSLLSHKIYDKKNPISNMLIYPSKSSNCKISKQDFKKLDEYEKVFFWWIELNLFVENFLSDKENHMFIKYEDFFSTNDDKFLELLKFLNISDPMETFLMLKEKNVKFDKYSHKKEYKDITYLYKKFEHGHELAKKYNYI